MVWSTNPLFGCANNFGSLFSRESLHKDRLFLFVTDFAN